MMKSFSILLSFILLASPMYLTIGTHFCGGEAVETKILFWEKHLGCEMTDMEKPCNDSQKTDNKGVSFDKIPCCENEYQTVRVTNEYVEEATQIVSNVEFTLTYIYTTLNLHFFTKSTNQGNTEYFPLPLEKDIQVLFQTFLI